MTSNHNGLLKQKNKFAELGRFSNMAAVSLFWKTNMAAMTSRGNETSDEFFDFLGGAIVGAPANQS